MAWARCGQAARWPLRWLLVACLGAAAVAATPSTAVAQAAPAAAEIERQFRASDAQAALRRLDSAVAQRPQDASLRFLQAVLAAEQGRSAEAAQLFERMTQEFPELPEPYNNLAVLKAAAGQLDQARALLETALRLDPAYRTAHENLGDVFVRLAVRAYETAAAGGRGNGALAGKLQSARALATRP